MSWKDKTITNKQSKTQKQSKNHEPTHERPSLPVDPDPILTPPNVHPVRLLDTAALGFEIPTVVLFVYGCRKPAWIGSNLILIFFASHLEKIGLNEEIPLRLWFGRGFAGVLRISPLQRIWDKLVCGAMKLLVFVALALVEVKKMGLLGCQTAKEAIRCLTSVS